MLRDPGILSSLPPSTVGIYHSPGGRKYRRKLKNRDQHWSAKELDRNPKLSLGQAGKSSKSSQCLISSTFTQHLCKAKPHRLHQHPGIVKTVHTHDPKFSQCAASWKEPRVIICHGGPSWNLPHVTWVSEVMCGSREARVGGGQIYATFNFWADCVQLNLAGRTLGYQA